MAQEMPGHTGAECDNEECDDPGATLTVPGADSDTVKLFRDSSSQSPPYDMTDSGVWYNAEKVTEGASLTNVLVVLNPWSGQTTCFKGYWITYVEQCKYYIRIVLFDS